MITKDNSNYNKRKELSNIFYNIIVFPGIKILGGFFVLRFCLYYKSIDNWLLPFVIYFIIVELSHGFIMYRLKKDIRDYLYYIDQFISKRKKSVKVISPKEISFSGGPRSSDEEYEAFVKMFYKANKYLGKYINTKEKEI